MDPVDQELLEGMGNCYSACHDDFEGTVRMVAQARDRTPEDVIASLRRIRGANERDAEYRRLRGRFPAEFPV